MTRGSRLQAAIEEQRRLHKAKLDGYGPEKAGQRITSEECNGHCKSCDLWQTCTSGKGLTIICWDKCGECSHKGTCNRENYTEEIA